jgi:DNA-binding transcriptional regulator YdaS (Cro superfamily)
MKVLTAYLNDLAVVDQQAFAQRCGTSLGYLRKAVSAGQKLGESLCISIDRESGGAVPCEALRPDVDWAYLRTGGAPYVRPPEISRATSCGPP